MNIPTITRSAKDQLMKILVNADSNYARLGLSSSGCTGFKYTLEIDNGSLLGEDVQIEISNGKFLLIDDLSAKYFGNMEIDYIKDGLNEHFVFKNPNEKERCGCNKSVSFD